MSELSPAKAVRRARAGLGGKERPIGCFLFTGPTGVGKTELSKQLARVLGVPFLRFDMSEYMEKHAVARLIGAPPGYVGYDQGGQLVEKIRKQPYAVLLLDEIEKAHADLFDILLVITSYSIHYTKLYERSRGRRRQWCSAARRPNKPVP